MSKKKYEIVTKLKKLIKMFSIIVRKNNLEHDEVNKSHELIKNLSGDSQKLNSGPVYCSGIEFVIRMIGQNSYWFESVER